MTLSDLITVCTGIIAHHKSNPGMNMLKLQEECGELAVETLYNFEDRQNTIDEIADVVICAVAQGTFIQLTSEELTEALFRKAQKGLTN